MLGKLNLLLEKSKWIAGSDLSLADLAFLANVGVVKVLKVFNLSSKLTKTIF